MILDFKSSNILLDEQWNAKLSNFGLVRLGLSQGSTHISSAVGPCTSLLLLGVFMIVIDDLQGF
jgi:serine/threonine protein kinase